MAKPSSEAYRPLFERAQAAENGIYVKTNDPKALRQEILAARRELKVFDNVMTFLPEGRQEVWLIMESVEMPDI